MSNVDAGKHYRHSYTVKVTQEDLEQGYITINLDPFRIAAVCKMTCSVAFTMMKKSIRMGTGGHKDARQDCLDIINAAERKLQMLDEDGE